MEIMWVMVGYRWKGDKGLNDLEISRLVHCIHGSVLPYMGKVGGTS